MLRLLDLTAHLGGDGVLIPEILVLSTLFVHVQRFLQTLVSLVILHVILLFQVVGCRCMRPCRGVDRLQHAYVVVLGCAHVGQRVVMLFGHRVARLPLIGFCGTPDGLRHN